MTILGMTASDWNLIILAFGFIAVVQIGMRLVRRYLVVQTDRSATPRATQAEASEKREIAEEPQVVVGSPNLEATEEIEADKPRRRRPARRQQYFAGAPEKTDWDLSDELSNHRWDSLKTQGLSVGQWLPSKGDELFTTRVQVPTLPNIVRATIPDNLPAIARFSLRDKYVFFSDEPRDRNEDLMRQRLLMLRILQRTIRDRDAVG